MEKFELELWHLMVFLFTIVIGIFKREIALFFQGLLLIWHKPYSEGAEIQMMMSSGDWADITIVEYKAGILFIKKGGVFICHKEKEGVEYLECISLVNWLTTRTRAKV